MRVHSLFLFLLMLAAVAVSGQTTYGIAGFTLPRGWTITEQPGAMLLEDVSGRGPFCRIMITSTLRTGPITAESYLQYRSSKSVPGFKFPDGIKAVTTTAVDGFVSFRSAGSGLVDDANVYSYFYSFSNGQQTFFVQLLTTGNDCITIFNQFLTTLQMEEASTGAKASKRGRPKKSAFAAPAPQM